MADGKVIIDTGLDTSGIEKDFASLGSIAQKGLSGLTVAIGAISTALAGIGGYAIKVGSDFEAGMSEVGAISGATASEVEQLTAKAKEMGAKTKFSATESASAFKYMAMAGWETSDMLDGIEGIMNLAAASGEDLASVSDIVTDALTAFGLQASDSAHFADVLAKASSSSNTNVGLMGETFKYVAPVAGALGYSAEDAAVAIGLMANAGIKGSQSGTALRGILTRLVKPTDEVESVMSELGISLTKENGEMKSLNEVMENLRGSFAGFPEDAKASLAAILAGQEGMSGLLAILNTSDEEFNKLTQTIYNCNGAAQETAETMQDNLKGDITLLQSAVEGLGIQFYESMDDGLREVVQDGIGYIDQLSKAFGKDGLEGTVETAGDIFGDIAVKAAQQAPKMVDASVKFIEAFIKGLSKNKGKLTKSAGDLVKTLADALIKLLPKSMQKPAKDAVDAIIKTLTGNSLKTGLDKLGNMFEKLGDVIGKLSSVVLPPLTSAFDFCASHLDLMVAALAAGVVAFEAYKILGAVTQLMGGLTATTAMLTAAEEANALQVIAASGALTAKEMIIGVVTGKITLATAAQTAWNAVMAANPIGLVITAVAALAAGIGILCIAQGDACDITDEETQRRMELNARLKEEADAIREAAEARAENVAAVNNEMGYYQQLWQELQSLVDENGKVKQGYEDRATFITSILSNALGTEIEMTDGVIQNYTVLRQSIEDLIASKKAEALLDVYKDDWIEALKNQKDAQDKLTEAAGAYNKLQSDVTHLESEMATAKAKVDAAQAQYNADLSIGTMYLDQAQEKYDELAKKLGEAKSALEVQSEALNVANNNYAANQAAINNYEEALGKVESGATDAGLSVLKMSNDFKSAGNSTREQLATQLTEFQQHYNNLKMATEHGYMEVSDTTLAETQALCLLAQAELMKLDDASSESIETTIAHAKELIGASDVPEAVSAKIAETGIAIAIANAETAPLVEQTAAQLPEAEISGIQSVDTTQAGQTSVYNVVEGMTTSAQENEPVVFGSMFNLGEAGNQGLEAAGMPENAKKETEETVKETNSTLRTSGPSLNKTSKEYFDNVNAGAKSANIQQTNVAMLSASTVAMMATIAGQYVSMRSTGKGLGDAVNQGLLSASLNTFASRQVNDFIDKLLNGIKGRYAHVTAAAKSLAECISKGVTSGNVPVFMQKSGTQMVDALVKAMNSGKSTVTSAGDTLAVAAHSGLSDYDLYSKAYSAGVNFDSGLAAGIRAGASQAINAAASVASQALEAAKRALAIRSPSRKMMEVGQYFDQGFVAGMENELGAVADVAERLGDTAIQSIEDMRPPTLGFELNMSPDQIRSTAAQMQAAALTTAAQMSAGIVAKIEAKVVASAPEKELIDYDKMANKIAPTMVDAFAKSGLALKYKGREVARMVREVVPI